jgi:hypothetical protein
MYCIVGKYVRENVVAEFVPLSTHGCFNRIILKEQGRPVSEKGYVLDSIVKGREFFDAFDGDSVDKMELTKSRKGFRIFSEKEMKASGSSVVVEYHLFYN